jgi:hypothetical protein
MVQSKKQRQRKQRSQRGGYGLYLGVDQDRIGGQPSVMRYSECPMTDTLSKEYPTALYNSQGGARRRRRTQKRRSRSRSRSHRKH